MKRIHTFSIRNLSVAVGTTPIVRGISLTLQSGELQVLMGQNGSGKSTLLHALMGHPKYTVKGSLSLDGKSLTKETITNRARKGLFLAFQNPVEIPGVGYGNFLRRVRNTAAEVRGEAACAPGPFAQTARDQLQGVQLDPAFISRSLHEGFSGGEKKKSEIVQMEFAQPLFAFLDEIDSGLDIDAVRIVLDHIKYIQKSVGTGVLLVTHNPGILEVLTPDKVHVMAGGKIVASGDKALARSIAKNGFEEITSKKKTKKV